jgi:hypothetical protein
MKLTNVLLFVCAGALAIAGSPSYGVTFFEPSVVAGKEFREGEYRITVKDGKAVMGAGKQRVETPVRVETANEKFKTTTVRYFRVDGKMKVEEIRVGGTNTRLIFTETAPTAASVN